MRLPALSLALLLPALAAHAGAGAFVSESRVEAVDQPGSPKTVFTVEPGITYPLLKKGGPDRAWCLLKGTTTVGWVLCESPTEDTVQAAPSASTLVAADHANTEMQQRRQEELESALRFERRKAIVAETGKGAGAGTADEEVAAPAAVVMRAPAGPAPAFGGAPSCSTSCGGGGRLFNKPPALKPVDKDVLDLCPTRPDASVSASDVQRFFAKNYDDPRLQRALSAAGRKGERQANIDWLTRLWVGTGRRNAFTHVFCGDDWDQGPTGGLHFLPRYAQLEAAGKVCYDGPIRRGNALVGDTYLIRFHGAAPWSCGVKNLGSIPRTEDAVGIASIGARAYASCCAVGGAKKEGGVFTAKDLGGARWQIWCGTRNGTYGIATLHPTDDAATCGE